MRKTIFDDSSRRQLIERIGRLRPDSQRRWGRMTPNEMICHLEDSMRCATGETPTRYRKSFMSNPFFRWLIIHVIPWPKGRAQTVKEMQATRPGDFEEDRRRLIAMLDRATGLGTGGSWAPHPAFGAMTGRDYGVLIHRHCDYHLRQFGH